MIPRLGDGNIRADARVHRSEQSLENDSPFRGRKLYHQA